MTVSIVVRLYMHGMPCCSVFGSGAFFRRIGFWYNANKISIEKYIHNIYIIDIF
jgi:hypothetical protein